MAYRTPSPFLLSRMRSLCRIQLSVEELSLIANVVKKRQANGKKLRLLVFGTGHDSKFWYFINKTGKTVFVEDNLEWLERAKLICPYLNIVPVVYDTHRKNWHEVIQNKNLLKENFPDTLSTEAWDIILIDAPDGSSDMAPGRMKSIFWASILASNNTDVFVHDCNREVESVCSNYFLGGTENLVHSVGRLRQYKGKEE